MNTHAHMITLAAVHSAAFCVNGHKNKNIWRRTL
jgi:hypothetical protein